MPHTALFISLSDILLKSLFFSESLAFAEFLPEGDESTRPQELIIPRWFWTLDLSKSTCDAIIQTQHCIILFMCCVSIMFHSKKSPVEIMVSLATWCEINWLCHIHQGLLWPTIWYTKCILTNYICYTNYFSLHTSMQWADHFFFFISGTTSSKELAGHKDTRFGKWGVPVKKEKE